MNGQQPALSPGERAVMVGRHRIAIACTEAMAAAVCFNLQLQYPKRHKAVLGVHVCARVRTRACVRDVFAILIYSIRIFDPG